MGPVTGIVVGATDVAAMGRFLALFGFEPVGAEVPGAWSVAGRGPTLHVVAVDVSPTPFAGRHGVECGPRAIDLYARDLDAALAAVLSTAVESGQVLTISPIGDIALGPVRMRQAMITGPDGVQVVLVESTHRRPSLLDDDPQRSVSEPYSVVWAVPDRDDEAARWVAAGATKGADLAFADPSLAAYLGLPSGDTVVHMVTLSDVAVSSGRIELMSFPAHREGSVVGSPPVSGILAVQFDDPAQIAVDGTGRTAGGIAVVPPTQAPNLPRSATFAASVEDRADASGAGS